VYPDDFGWVDPQGNYEYIIGTGTFYCDVIAANLEEWQIGIEVYQ
jgi:hypothetical protein